MTELVSAHADDGVLVVTLANPARRNVIDHEMVAALLPHVAQLPDDVAAVALLAEGDHFCVGGDVAAFGSAPDAGEFVGSLATAFHEVVRAMHDCRVPIVAGHRGWAAGAGMSVLLAADVVVSGSSASMRPAYPGIGVTPDGGMTWALPRLVGEKRALSILLGNRALSATDALDLGLVSEVVDDAEVDTVALARARALAASASGSMAGIRRLVLDGSARGLSAQLDAEAASIAACADSPEGREGVRAFLERREPDFPAVRRASAG